MSERGGLEPGPGHHSLGWDKWEDFHSVPLGQEKKGSPVLLGTHVVLTSRNLKLLVKFREELGCCKVTDPFLAGAFPTQELFPRKLHLLGKEATPSESWVGVGLLGRLPVCLCGSVLNFSHGFVSRPLLQFRRWTCPFRSILWSCTWELCLPVARGTTQTIPRAFAITIRGRPS